MKPAIRAIAATTLGACVVLALAGCLNSTTKPTSAPTAPSTATSTPTSHPTPTSPPTPVTLPCSTILTPQQVYDYNPNYVAQDSYTPTAGTDAARAVADSGVACGWVDETSGSVLSVAIAEPAASDLANLSSSAAGEAPAVSIASGATGYFTAAGGTGELQVFTSKYWVVISSADFAAAGDVQPTAQVVIGNIANH